MWVGGTEQNIASAFEAALRDEGLETDAHPNGVVGTLGAIEAKFGIPVLYTSRIGALTEERAASWLSKHFTYWWLEEHGHGRVLIDEDGL